MSLDEHGDASSLKSAPQHDRLEWADKDETLTTCHPEGAVPSDRRVSNNLCIICWMSLNEHGDASSLKNAPQHDRLK